MAAKLIYVTDEEFSILAKHLRMKDLGFDSLSLERKIIFMRDSFNEETKMPTKHIMTRVEAIDCFNKHMTTPSATSAERIINFYVAAGMLEIKEEEELPGLPIGFQFPFSKRDEWTNCVNEMFKQGFVIGIKK